MEFYTSILMKYECGSYLIVNFHVITWRLSLEKWKHQDILILQSAAPSF